MVQPRHPHIVHIGAIGVDSAAAYGGIVSDSDYQEIEGFVEELVESAGLRTHQLAAEQGVRRCSLRGADFVTIYTAWKPAGAISRFIDLRSRSVNPSRSVEMIVSRFFPLELNPVSREVLNRVRKKLPLKSRPKIAQTTKRGMSMWHALNTADETMPDFVGLLLENFPDLTENDLAILILDHAGYSGREIAVFLDTYPNHVYRTRRRITGEMSQLLAA